MILHIARKTGSEVKFVNPTKMKVPRQISANFHGTYTDAPIFP